MRRLWRAFPGFRWPRIPLALAASLTHCMLGFRDWCTINPISFSYSTASTDHSSNLLMVLWRTSRCSSLSTTLASQYILPHSGWENWDHLQQLGTSSLACLARLSPLADHLEQLVGQLSTLAIPPAVAHTTLQGSLPIRRVPVGGHLTHHAVGLGRRFDFPLPPSTLDTNPCTIFSSPTPHCSTVDRLDCRVCWWTGSFPPCGLPTPADCSHCCRSCCALDCPLCRLLGLLSGTLRGTLSNSKSSLDKLWPINWPSCDLRSLKMKQISTHKIKLLLSAYLPSLARLVLSPSDACEPLHDTATVSRHGHHL